MLPDGTDYHPGNVSFWHFKRTHAKCVPHYRNRQLPDCLWVTTSGGFSIKGTNASIIMELKTKPYQEYQREIWKKSTCICTLYNDCFKMASWVKVNCVKKWLVLKERVYGVLWLIWGTSAFSSDWKLRFCNGTSNLYSCRCQLGYS